MSTQVPTIETNVNLSAVEAGLAQAAASNARESIKVEGMAFPEVFPGDNDCAAPKLETQTAAEVPDPSPADPEKPGPVDPSNEPTSAPSDEKIDDFDAALDEIETQGNVLIKATENFQSNSRDASIHGLAKILGIYRKFLDNATPREKDRYESKLKARCGLKRNSKTSVHHLLSRIYRGQNAKQASSDAKVLKKAVDDGKSESDFFDWVKGEGGLDAIKKGVNEANKAAREAKPPKPPKAEVLWENAKEAVKALVANGQVSETFTFDKEEWPELFGKLRPDYANTSRLVIVNHTGDEIHFHILQSFRPFGINYMPKNPVNVDGTSANTWPAWMIAKPEAADGGDDGSTA